MNYWQLAIGALRATYLPACKAAVIYVPVSHLYICRESATNQPLFMQNKPNLRNDKMNVTSALTKDYENEHDLPLRQNKPKTKPIKPNFTHKSTQKFPPKTPKFQKFSFFNLIFITQICDSNVILWR